MKRPWTRTEMALMSAPLLFVAIAGALWAWREQAPYTLNVPDARSFTTFDFSPDGKRMAVFFEDSKTGVNKGQVYNLATRTKACNLSAPPPTVPPNPNFGAGRPYFGWPSWSPDGTRIVTGYDDGSRAKDKKPNPLYGIKKGPTFHQIAKIALWNAESGVLEGNYLYAPPNEHSYSRFLRFSPDGKTLFGAETPPSFFAADGGQRLRVLSGSFGRAYKGRISKPSGLLALQNNDLTRLQVYDPKTKRVLWEPQVGLVSEFLWGGDILGVIDSTRQRKGRIYGKNRLLLWSGKTRAALLAPPLPPSSNATNLSFSPDNSTLAVITQRWSSSNTKRKIDKVDSDLVVWDYNHHQMVWHHPESSDFRWARWSPDGKWLSLVADYSRSSPDGGPRKLLIFDRTGKLCIEQEIAEEATCWSPDSSRIAFCSRARDSSLQIQVMRVGD